jgi:hypothetical protein
MMRLLLVKGLESIYNPRIGGSLGDVGNSETIARCHLDEVGYSWK